MTHWPRCEADALVDKLADSLAKWRLVEMVVEERDDTVTDGPAEVMVQTLGRGRGIGGNGHTG